MSSVPSQSQQSAHQVEIHKENARELYPLLKALMFREVSAAANEFEG